MPQQSGQTGCGQDGHAGWQAHPHPAGWRGFPTPERRFYLLCRRQHAASPGKQVLAIIRQVEMPRRAMQQPHTEMVFQLSNQARYAAMAAAGFTGDRGEGTGFDNPHERPKGVEQIHARIPSGVVHKTLRRNSRRSAGRPAGFSPMRLQRSNAITIWDASSQGAVNFGIASMSAGDTGDRRKRREHFIRCGMGK